MLRFRHRMLPRKMAVYTGGGQTERLLRLRQIVTGLIRYERVEPSWAQADEARQYAERLLYLAIKNGDTHRPTMELADFWLLEKDLIHKLFKVLVPRYINYKTCYTDLHRLAVNYPGSGFGGGVLELKENPWPPVVTRQRDTKYMLSNMLLSAARQDYYSSNLKQAQASSPSQNELSSSVDPQPDKNQMMSDKDAL